MPVLKEYPQYPRNIPFENGNETRLKIMIADDATDSQIRDAALDRYITHYFPEFYMNLIEGSSFSGDATDYNDLRDILSDGLTIEHPGFNTKPPSNKQIVITLLDLGRSVYQMRNEWERTQRLPDFQTNLEFFNARHGISAEVLSQTELPLHTLRDEVATFADLMGSFKSQMDNYNGAIPLGGLNFSSLDSTVQKIVNIAALEIAKDIEGQTGEAYAGVEGDLMTLYFGPRTAPPFDPDLIPEPDDPLGIFNNHIALNGIVYFSAEDLITDFFKVGYFSLIKYQPFFTDQITLKTLQNYHQLLSKNTEYTTAGTQFPMFEFLSETLPNQIGQDDASGNFFSFPTDNNRDNGSKSALEKEAIRLGLIDVNDTDELQQGIKALTSEELAELKRQVAKNPELYEKVYQEEKKKKLKTGRDIADTIERALQTGPLALYKKGSAVDRVLSQLGIKALAKEALICLTFGVNIEAARIAAVIGNVLEEELNERPPTDPTQFELFKIKGDIGKQILDIILNSLKSTLMSIIKGLADLLREVCNLNNPRASDFGATDLGNLASNFPAGAENPFGFGNDENSPLGDLSDMLGMDPSDIYEYLTAVSQILSSIDICILLTDITSASDELIERIIEFNKNYFDVRISTQLIEFSPVIEFWTMLGNIVDVTDLCNEILTDISLLNQDNICLDVGELSPEEQDNIDELIDLIENGFQQTPPVFNFDCPDAENYINDPVMTRLIPETLSTMVELVEMQFIYSTDSIKNILLEPVLNRVDDGSATGNKLWDGILAATAGAAQDYPELPKPNADIMAAIASAFERLQNDPAGIQDAIETCMIDTPDLLAPGLRNIGEAISALIDILGDPAVEDAFGNIVDKMSTLASGSAGVPVVTSYAFKQNFYDAFINYIDIGEADFVETGERSARIADLQVQLDQIQAFIADPSQMPLQSAHIIARLERAEVVLSEELDRLQTEEESYIIPEHFKRYTVSTDTTNYLQFSFPRFNADEPQVIDIPYPAYNSTSPFPAPTFNLSALFDNNTAPLFGTEIAGSTGTSIPYSMDPFVDALQTTQALPGYQSVSIEFSEQMYFPFAYGVLTDQVFDYYIENGIFDAGALQSLNFFHDNANCAADSVADLLDVEGIFKQMQQEYLEEACNNDAPTSRERMREVIKFGMFLLLVQVHIAEFVLKNIFVFAAVKLDELFAKDFIESYMTAQVNASIESYFNRVIDRELIDRIKDSLIVIFNRIIIRPNIVAEGGITDMNGTVIFPTGTIFVKEGDTTSIDPNVPTANFNDIIHFVSLYRIQSSMGTPPGAEEPRSGAVSNALQQMLPVSNQKSTEEIFLTSMPVVATSPEVFSVNGDSPVTWTTGLDSSIASARTYAVNVLNDTLSSQTAPAAAQPGSALAKPQIIIKKSVGQAMVSSETAEGSAFESIDPGGDSLPEGDAEDQALPTGPAAEAANLPPGHHLHLTNTLLPPYTESHPNHWSGPWQPHTGASHDPPDSLGTSYAGPPLPEEGQDGDESEQSPGSPFGNMAAAEEEAEDITGLAPLATGELTSFDAENWINYECWLYIPNTLDFDLHIDSGLPQRMAIKLFETAPLNFVEALADANAEEAERYNQAVIDQAVYGGPTPVLKTEAELRAIILRSYSLDDPTEIEKSTLSPAEIEHILDDPTYKSYFTNVFSQEIVSLLPIVHNFYLTNHYFGDIRQAMRSTKNRVLEILNSTIVNHDNYNSLPDLSRPAARQAALTTDEPDGESMARDFILKMLIKTPIDIIKGLMQLIDPHVVVSKFIKSGTAEAFGIIGDALNNLDLPSPDTAGPLAPFSDTATGKDLFISVLCLLEWLMANPTAGPAAVAAGQGIPIPPNFFPRISEDGVDFLGTGMGMLMIPPTPLGLIYLLLSLINFDNPQTNVEVGVYFGSDYTEAGTDPSSCDDELPEGQAASALPEPLERVRPPYVEPEA